MVKILKEEMSYLAFALLDATTRTWAAFFGTIIVIIFYCWCNISPVIKYHFDPYPFVFLMVLIATLSYLQNIVIMTLQRKQDAKFADIKLKQEKQDLYMLEMMETQVAQSKLLITLAHKDAERDDKMLSAFLSLPCRNETSL